MAESILTLDTYSALLKPRVIEEKMLRLIRQGRLTKWFSGYGQEAIAVGCALALQNTDFLLPSHRNLGLWTTRGVPLKPLLCQLMGKAGGFTRGRDRTFHFGLPEYHIIGMISHLAAMLPVACGLALGAKLDRENSVACVFTGDGATREGDFHEALNLAAIWKLPVLFVVENNGYGLSTPTAAAVPITDIADAAAGYGIPGIVVDGNDLERIVHDVHGAAERARLGEGPTLLEMKTFRIRGHEEASGTKYVPPELIQSWSLKDPIARFEQRLLQEGVADEKQLNRIRGELVREVEEAVEWALQQPEPESSLQDELQDVFAPASRVTSSTAETGESTNMRFVDALHRGLEQALEEDERVLLLGQDIAEYGGVFKVTEGLVERFGNDRIRNTPIIESGVIGAALGLALKGYRPVVEMQYADFISCGFNQIVNNLATTHYRWGSPVPVVIRAPFGGGIGAGPFHSQSVEAWFCHVPGLKVVVPATPADAQGLLLSSIDDPNPVLFLEHKKLYRTVKGSVPLDALRVPLGVGRIARSGYAATVVTWGIGVHWALAAAEDLRHFTGAEVEIIDLRTLVPWDREMVHESVARTHRLMVLHEATLQGGFGAEIAAEVAEHCFGLLDASPTRLGAPFMPIPFSAGLESLIYSPAMGVSRKLQELLDY